MNPRNDEPLEGVTLDSSVVLTLEELCDICCVPAERVQRLVDEGIVEPVGREPREWRFTRVSVTRVRFAERVRRDLDVNTAGAALALDLLEEIDRLRARLRRPG